MNLKLKEAVGNFVQEIKKPETAHEIREQPVQAEPERYLNKLLERFDFHDLDAGQKETAEETKSTGYWDEETGRAYESVQECKDAQERYAELLDTYADVAERQSQKESEAQHWDEAQEYSSKAGECREQADQIREQLTAHCEKIDGKKIYYDDNGTKYREDNDLLPDNEYELGGYTYKTDDKGRIKEASGTLRLKTHEGRLPMKDTIEDIGKGDQREGDDRGHLIGDQFDGSNGLENMIPQDAKVNRISFKNFENELAKEVQSGKNVTVSITPVYPDGSRRPSEIYVTYKIDGKISVQVFPNEQEE